jgi:putative peptide zinc metalloprotease protein
VPVTSRALERAEGLSLIGEARGSGYRTPPALVRRVDGQTLQLTPLLYEVVHAVDGRRSADEVAAVVRDRTGRPVSAGNVEQLVEEQLRPLGLLTKADGSQPEVKRANPLLGLRAKVAVTDPRRTRQLTAPFTPLFSRLVWVPVVAVFLGLVWWLLMEQGLAAAAKHAFDRPLLLLTVFAVTVLSAGFHEFGHAAAARRGGAQPGVMGAGVYLVWPAFYTDVTDSYRLDRAGRIRTDLGGLYFNAIVAVGIVGLWLLTGSHALLLVVVTQILQMLRQLLPMVRFDGYHVLADLTGVPDLFSRIGPVLKSLRPGRPSDPRVTALKPWARAVVTTWVLVTVPALLLALFAMVVAFPRLAGTAWASLQRHAGYLRDGVADMQVVDSAAALLSVVAIVFPIAAMAFIFSRVSRQLLLAGWRKSEGSLLGRAGVIGVTAVVVAALAFLWWPREGAYRPIEDGERGTLQEVMGSLGPRLTGSTTTATTATMASTTTTATASAVPVAGTPGRAVTVLPASAELPTQARPMPALVLVPSGSGSAGPTPGGTPTPDQFNGSGEPTWVFPFNKPLPPGEGDTQALAVNTADNSVKYDVAMAMVWVEDAGKDHVLNKNEAIAYASCSDCVTVAISFQVLVIVGQADVIVPQNTAQALNYQCFECITIAIAKQLVVTVAEMPGEDKLVELTDIWGRLAQFATTIPALSVNEILARLEEFEEQIKAVLVDAVHDAPGAEPSSDASTATSEESGQDSTDSRTAEGSTDESSPTSTSSSPTSSSPSPTSSPTPSTSSPTSSTSPTSPSSSPTAETTTTEPSPTSSSSQDQEPTSTTSG